MKVEFRHSAAKVRSDNLFQLFSYLKNIEAKGGLNSRAEGTLLYPTVDQHIDLAYEIQGHRVRVYTIDLAKNWQEIHSSLLHLLEPPWQQPRPPRSTELH
jgi:5-methylcytosine-specific restriction enzyme subunit McrC